MTNQEEGRKFEKEIEREFNLLPIPGSGNQWYSKLDLKGKLIRWSLKWTGAESYRLTCKDVDEAVEATQGVAGSGETPMILLRIGSPEYDLVVMRKNDFIRFTEGEFEGTFEERVTGGDKRRARSRVPVLLREDNGS